MKEQNKRYKIVEKYEKIKFDDAKNYKFSKKQKILILIVSYFLCCAVIIGLIFAIMY